MKVVPLALLPALLLTSALAAQAASVPTPMTGTGRPTVPANDPGRSLHQFGTVAMSPDGHHVASIEYDDLPGDVAPPSRLVIRDLSGAAVTVALPCGAGERCDPREPAWSPDGSRLVFLLDRADGSTEIDSVAASGGAPKRLATFRGPVAAPRFSRNGTLAVLAVLDAHKKVGATAAAAPMVGDIGSHIDEQRIAIVENGALRFVSPANLYVYEYDWRNGSGPNGNGFVATAATGNGDSDWWIAKLYRFDADGSSHVLFDPGPREQLADPVVSPDGRTVAFVGGWMSDQGSTGGDAYVLRLDHPGAAPVNLTPNAKETVTSLDWGCGPGLTGVALGGERTVVRRLIGGDGALASPVAAPLWQGADTLGAGGWNLSISCGGGASAAVRQSFTSAPEIVAGPIGAWHPITRANDGFAAPFTVRSLSWRDDGFDVQGWLIEPHDGAPADTKRPMVVLVHGGPEAAAENDFPAAHGLVRALLAEGWDVLEPNYRGSFGQGERFAQGSIGDIGGGDWRDVLSGVDAAERAAPIDEHRLGITGGSYGGYMSMWAVTQTHRFRAAVADAGVSDWLSIEGEAPQAGSDEVNFNGSVYDNDAPYLKSSPVTHMKGVDTPSLVLVGERDVECPMPQSQEFFTALQALHVPSEFIVYAGEGHHLAKQADRDDLRNRTVGWFKRWFATAT